MTAAPEDNFFAPYWEEVEVGFGARAPQSRVSVGLRLLFVLPHLLVVVVLAAASLVLAIVGWFAALKLGRLPRWIAVFQMRWIAYHTRVYAYLFLLVDKYPPFSLTAADYPVTVEIVPSRLAGPAVFFRLVLLIPAYVVLLVAIAGLVLFSPLIWVMTLFARQMPPPFFAATSSVVRYQARYAAYAVLLTDEYPRRLFGDPEGREVELRLVLPREAKNLLIAMVVVGAVASSLGAARLAIGGGNSDAAALVRLGDATDEFGATVRHCRPGPRQFRCFEKAERTWSAAWMRYGQDIADGHWRIARHSRRMAAISASTSVAIALIESASAKTDSAHLVAFENVRRKLSRFNAVLSSPRYGSR